MTLSDPKNTNPANNDITEDMEQSSMQGGAYIDRSLKEDPSSPIHFDLYDLESKLQIHLTKRINTIFRWNSILHDITKKDISLFLYFVFFLWL